MSATMPIKDSLRGETPNNSLCLKCDLVDSDSGYRMTYKVLVQSPLCLRLRGGARGKYRKKTNPAKIHKGRARDSCLVAPKHVECVNPAQMHKGRIRDVPWLQSYMLSD